MFRALLEAVIKCYLRIPEHWGKYRVVRWLGRYVIPAVGLMTTVSPGIRLNLHPRDWVEYLLLRGEDYEPRTLDFLMANLQRDDTALLAGVNFGLHVAVAARAVGPEGRVIGIEPQADALLQTFHNLALNGLTRQVQLFSGILGGTERFCRMAWSRSDNRGAASIYDPGDGFFSRVSTVASVLGALGNPTPRVLLLDVQGCEVEALDGIEAGPRPDILIVELVDEYLRMAGTTGTGMMDRMTSLGYELFTLHGQRLHREDQPIPEQNVIGVQPGANPVWVPRSASATRGGNSES